MKFGIERGAIRLYFQASIPQRLTLPHLRRCIFPGVDVALSSLFIKRKLKNENLL